MPRRVAAIRSGDTLDVQIAGEPELSGQFPVTASGVVKLPGFLGVFKAAGSDTARFADIVAERARKYLVEPTVMVSVVGRPSSFVNVLGEVSRQGSFDLDQAPTLLSLLALAGGVAPTGDASRITIVRGGREQRVLPEGTASGPEVIPPDVGLLEGDTVVVPRRALRFVMVTGAVQRAGYFAVDEAGSATRALIMAGGAAAGAELSRSYVMRGADRIEVDLAALLSGAAGTQDVALEDKDVLVVPLVSSGGVPGAPEMVVLAGALARTGPLPLAQARTAALAVTIAGGFAPEAKPEASYVIRAGGRVDLDLRAILNGTAPDMTFQANDIVVVPMLPRDLTYVIGAVARPGPQFMLGAGTVVTAVTMAGGATPTADLKAAYLVRQGQRVSVDIEAALGDQGADVVLQPNDLVVIPETSRMPVYVVGAVSRPGALAAAAAPTVAKAVSLAGGTLPQADARHAFILRAGGRQDVDVESIMAGAPDVALQPNDLLTIPVMTAAGQMAQSVVVFGAVARPSVIPLSSAGTARRAILMAGGLLPSADPANAQIMRRDQLARFDLDGVLAGRVEDFAVDGGDVIMVPQKSPDVVYLTGAVGHAGPQLLAWCNTLTRGLALAGALPQGDLAGAFILRGSDRLGVDAERVLAGADPDIQLVANDVVVIPVQTPVEEAANQAARSVAVMGAVTRPGLLTPEQGATVARAMAWVGGTLAQADLEHSYLLRDNQTVALNLLKLGTGVADAPDTMELQAGDVVVVPALTPELAAAQQLARGVMVVGGVVRPGVVDATQAGTAWRAVVLSGGPAEGADLAGAYLMRGGERLAVDLQAVSSNGSGDQPVRAGDVVVVPVISQESVFVAGAVQRPGPLARYHARTAAVALTMAGGPVEGAVLEEAYILRDGARVPVTLQADPSQPAGGAVSDVALEANDLLFIPARFAQTVYVAGAVLKPGAYGLSQARTALVALTLAGGTTAGAETQSAYVLRDGARVAVDLRGAETEPSKDLPLAQDDVLVVPLVSPEPVYVVGSVRAPGPQPLAQARTAGQALVMAGGAIDDVGDLKSAYILRNSERLAVDLDAVLNQGQAGADCELQANDALVIPKLDDEYHVAGEVLRPGPLTLKQGKTVLEALALAGGPAPTADLKAATILRDGQAISVDLEALTDARDYTLNVELQAGDTLVVPRAVERVFVFGQVGRPGAYPFTSRETLMDVIAKAGGIGAQARLDRIWLIRATQPGEPVEPATPVASPAPPKPSEPEEATVTPWLEQRYWGDRERETAKSTVRQPSKPVAQPPKAQKPRDRFELVELARLPQGSAEAKPRDGDLIYVPAAKERKQDLLQWALNLLPGWLLYRR